MHNRIYFLVDALLRDAAGGESQFSEEEIQEIGDSLIEKGMLNFTDSLSLCS